MKKITLLLLLLFASNIGFAFSPVVNYAIFSTPDQKSYIETYLLVPSTDVKFVAIENGKYQAAVEVTILFKQGEKIIQFDKYLLHSPVIDQLEAVNFNLTDLKRNALKDGTYTLDILFKDTNHLEKEARYTKTIKVGMEKDELTVSDIMLIDQYEAADLNEPNIYTKNGYHLYPNVLNYFGNNINRIAFYAEIYNTEQKLEETDFLVLYSIRLSSDNNKIIQNLRSFQKKKAALVNVAFSEFDISDLPSGNYNLIIEVRDKKNKLLAAKAVFFQRNKKVADYTLSDIHQIDISDSFVAQLDDKQADYYLRAILPIADPSTKDYINNLVAGKNPELQRRFIHNYWKQHYPFDAAEQFEHYKAQIQKVEELYGSQMYDGFETDRGRVFLQYGPPNDLTDGANEPGAAPYQIWQYYQLASQSNVQFVFYNPNFADNDYELIHSTARGELRDDRWQMRVFNSVKDRNNNTDFDQLGVKSHYGTRVNEFGTKRGNN
ncbi:MAG: GWxTD domain-containing protein [Chitinophagales bacterium]